MRRKRARCAADHHLDNTPVCQQSGGVPLCGLNLWYDFEGNLQELNDTSTVYFDMGIVSKSQPSKVILSVEDEDSTFLMLKIAFDELKLPVSLYRAIDGEEGLLFLHQQGAYVDAPRPALILLNINLPKRTGVELLAAVKANPALASIPVVMFTSSDLEVERVRCLALGAEAYLVKPMAYDDVLFAVESAFSMASPATA